MKVRAKFKKNGFGFYGTKRVRDGEEFILTNPAHFSKIWMEKVEDEKSDAKPEGKPRKAKAKPEGSEQEGGES